MITVGLIKEFYFISHTLNQPVECEFSEPVSKLRVRVANGVLDIWWGTIKNDDDDTWFHIWHETIDGPASCFGVESCDTISRIIALLESDNLYEAEKLFFNEKKIDFPASSS